MQYKKYQNQARMNLAPPTPSQNSHAVRWYYYYYYVLLCHNGSKTQQYSTILTRKYIH